MRFEAAAQSIHGRGHCDKDSSHLRLNRFGEENRAYIGDAELGDSPAGEGGSWDFVHSCISPQIAILVDQSVEGFDNPLAPGGIRVPSTGRTRAVGRRGIMVGGDGLVAGVLFRELLVAMGEGKSFVKKHTRKVGSSPSPPTDHVSARWISL